MLGQKQELGNFSTALQAKGDIHYQGASITEILKICELFFESNFPKLREIAAQHARENIKEFAAQLSKQMIENGGSIKVESLESPDVQASINDAVAACARKGDAANPQLLSSLLVAKMAEDNNDFIDTVLSEAISVVPRLTKDQVLFLGLLQVLRYLNPQPASFTTYERLGKSMLPLFKDFSELSVMNLRHMDYAGAISYQEFLQGDVYQFIYAQFYPGKGDVPTAEFLKVFKKFAPSYVKLINMFISCKGASCTLTSVGHAIGLGVVRGIEPSLKYSAWIK
ncbi:LPO_1073/Vpar_1526 family protein [Delftia acidovorans]|uniref:LPO_1073/Vpar_1526 family protein n=1 Tax=Delftia acidovorans TaxID=80866 RepID=UPI0022ABAFCC|nr:LPO_1073/Vpar_1526 family protein [Delftia acidovorans]WAT83536.1 hypothetical protein O1V13_19025 [Delftia acidovorans]